ncbi:hypothetical protein [Enterococcus wangshanyuanii]|uniref:FtsX-like permease family protein n=1 Tax=Enterococcus wangshanyuanii TaxID=2005703 RepID=A0ABQ1NH09_9ENTE|nr:hypothetical protein [Enterococcus wangshanyuanii]GGC76788.1 hypothetical protein GCM10011573_03010 [Enterococcus wangshanyuanii]
MNTLSSILIDSGRFLLRNKWHSFIKSFSIIAYFFISTLLIRIGLTLKHFETLEREHLLSQTEMIDAFSQTAALRNLIFLLTTLKNGLLLISLGLFIAGLFYLFIHFQQVLLVDKKELIIKKLLGSSGIRVTSEIFSDFLLLAIPSTFIGVLSTELLYADFFRTNTSWIKDFLYTPGRFFLCVDLPLMGVFGLVLLCQFLHINKQVTRL